MVRRFEVCEAHAFLVKDGSEEKLLENVHEVEVEGDEIRIVNIFGEQKMIKAKIKSYNNSERKIMLEAIE